MNQGKRKYQKALLGPLIPPYLFLLSTVIEDFSVLTISGNSRKWAHVGVPILVSPLTGLRSVPDF